MQRHSFLPLALPLLAFAPLQQSPRDLSKREVELPLERALELASAPAFDAPAARPSAAVQPGLVRWHADLDAARAAARVSGKPVLLFQLFGRLDDELC